MTLRWWALSGFVVASVVAVAAVSITPGVSPARRGARPAVVGDDEDLATHATIRRDTFGIAHILADSEAAAAFAHGYVTAEDHGLILAKALLRARGASASVFGPKFVDDDIRARTLGIHDVAAARFHELPPFMQGILNGYAAGVNRYLAQHRAEVPEWVTPATGVDILAHCRTVLLLDFALDLSQVTPTPPPPTAASNMWAIGRGLSQSGHGMLFANPHLGWQDRQLLQEVQITVPDVINISGATFVGVPVVTMGFNQVLGWSHTVNRIDSDDVYELTLDAAHTHYAYDGRWLPLDTRNVSVDVKTDRGVQPQTRAVLVSHYGPVFRVEGDKAYAFKSANLEDVQFLTQYNAMAKATSLRTFAAAVNMQQLPMFNVAYADRDGNIWYVYDGRIPIRPNGYNWSGIVPGNTSKTEWFAMRPLSELPQLLNPPTGYVQNCNDAPWYANLEQRIDRKPFSDYLTTDGVTWRSVLSLRILSSEKGLTLDRLKAYKFDTEVILAERLKGDLLKAVRARGDRLAQAAKLLEAWDNRTDAGSRGAVLFLAWWQDYSHLVQKPFSTPFAAADPLHTPAGLADPARAVEAFERAVATVTQTYGALDVPWGDVHRLRRGTIDMPAMGAPMTLQNVLFHRDADGKDVVEAGDSYVLVVEFGESPQAFTLMPYSASSDPRSKYFNNQLPLYAHEQFKPAWFTERDIAAHLDRQYRPGD